MNDDARFFRFDTNRVVAASAGTGKTFRLAGIAVHALLGASEVVGELGIAVQPSRLVATTFSRKAAVNRRWLSCWSVMSWTTA